MMVLDLTGFYSPPGKPWECRVQVDERELVVTVARTPFTVRGRRLVVGSQAVELANVLEVRVGRGEQSALRRATRALELVIRDKAGGTDVWRPLVREAPEVVAWGVARLREVLGHVPTELPAPFDESSLKPLVVRGRGSRGGVVLAREGDGVAVVQFGTGKVYLRLHADADELRADVVAWGFARSLRWRADEIFAVGSVRGGYMGHGEPGADYGLQLRLVDGRRVRLESWTREGGAAAAAEMLKRALRVPSQAEWGRRFLASAGEVAAPVALRRRAENRAGDVSGPAPSTPPPGAPVLSYANSPEREIRVTLGGGTLTVRTLVLPPLRAWARAMIVNWPVLTVVLVVGGLPALALVFAFAPRPSPIDGLWVFVAIAIWSGLCAIAGIGHHALVTLDAHGLSLHVEGVYGRRDHYWLLDEIERVEAHWNRVVLRTRGGSRTLVCGDDARELRELAGLLNAAVGAEPPAAVAGVGAPIDSCKSG